MTTIYTPETETLSQAAQLKARIEGLISPWLGYYEEMRNGIVVSAMKAIRIRPPELPAEVYRFQEGEIRVDEKPGGQAFIDLPTPLATILSDGQKLYFPNSEQELTVSGTYQPGDQQINILESSAAIGANEFFELGGIECIVARSPEYDSTRNNFFVLEEMLKWEVSLLQRQQYQQSLMQPLRILRVNFDRASITTIPYRQTPMGVAYEQAKLTIEERNYAKTALAEI